MMEYKLRMEGVQVPVGIDQGHVVLGKERIAPTAVSWDTRRRFPYILVLLIGITIIGAGALAGAAVASAGIVWAAVVIVLPVTVLGLLFLWNLMGGHEDVIVVKGRSKEYVLTGDRRTLQDLHYAVSKLTIAAMKRDERERIEGRAGSYQGSEVLDRKEHESLQKDMKRFIGKRKTVTTTICPDCGSSEMYYEAGLITGYVYHCKKCDYVGSFVLEKELQV
jgi:predicted RNA-binding Zn-ribbon protein involved in translation (DUF1610 family)